MPVNVERSHRDTYWANDPPDKLVNELEDKTRLYFRQLRNGIYWRRCLRNLAYYHNLYYDDTGDSINMELKALGKQGEFVGLAGNHFRNFGQHFLNLTTRDALALNCRATNTDSKSLKQAKLGKGVAEHYLREMAGEETLRSAVEHSYVFATSYVASCWEPNAGPRASEEMGSGPLGDIDCNVITPLDIIFDYSSRDWAKKSWVAYRTYVNKWDLAKRYPEQADDIVNVEEDEELFLDAFRGMIEMGQEDVVPLWRFFHKKCDAIPTGRYFEYLPGIPLRNEVLQYTDIPVRRVSSGEWLLSLLGWTAGFDIQGPQEMYNGALSSIASAVSALGLQDVWVQEGSEKIRSKVFEGGLRVLSSATKPEALNLLKIAPELMKFPDILIALMERVTGINAVVRGDPDPTLKSGEALKVIEAKAVQSNSGLQFSYYRLVEDVATDWINILKKFAGNDERMITIIGKSNRQYRESFTADSLDVIDRVVVEVANPLQKSLAGKLHIAKDLMAMGEIRNKEQYLELLQTGNMDVLFESENAQLAIIQEENEFLRKGEMIPPPAMGDNQILHLREHLADMGTLEARGDQQARNANEAHSMIHVKLLLDPNVQRLQIALGYTVPDAFLVPPGMPAVPAPATPPGGGERKNGTGGGPPAPPRQMAEGGPTKPEELRPARPPKELVGQR